MQLHQTQFKSSVILKRLVYDHVSPHKKQIIIAVLFMVVVAICTAVGVSLVEPAVNQVIINHDKRQLVVLPLTMFAIHCIKGVAEFFQSYFIKCVGQRILTDLQMKMYTHLIYADLALINSYSSGKLISRFTNDISLMRGAVSNMLVGCAKHFLSVLFLVIIMFVLDPVLSCIIFLVFPASIYPIQKIGRKMRYIFHDAQEELSVFTGKLDEVFKSIKIIKSFGAEQIEISKAKTTTNYILNLYTKSAKFDALTSPIMEILSGIAIACILWYGGASTKTSAGELVGFIAAFFSAYRPFKSLVSLNVNLQEGIAAANRVFNILDYRPSIYDRPNAKEVDLANPYISFRNVSLNIKNKKIIKSINVDFTPGKKYAIVGRSGSGKTSLVNLLLRFYEAEEGGVFINNQNIKDIKISSLRQQIALVSQETMLFNASIAENISYGTTNATLDQIEKASREAYAEEFIIKLADNYNTILETSAVNLSGGQKQRVAIARAFLKDAPILILDEATSNLDLNAEKHVLNSLYGFNKKQAIFIITHRLSSVKNVDEILVMKDGEVAEQGTHEELMRLEGEYAFLYNKELKYKELQERKLSV